MEMPPKLIHKCSFCNYTCRQLLHLESHMRKHTREKPFCCDQCNRVFSTQAHLSTHVKNLHHPRPPKVYTETFKCSFCPYEEHSKVNFDRHVLNHTGERKYPCLQPNCEYAAKTLQELQRHNINKHRHERKFKCPFPNCGYRGKSKRMVRFHYVSNNECKPFTCDFEGCAYQARRNSNLKAHKLAMHSDGSRPFACSECKFSTTSNRLLKQHGLTHTEEKPFKCGINGCAYATKLKTSLTLHIGHRHMAKNLKCDFQDCSFVGASLRILNFHKKTVHSEKIYKCPYCDFRGVFLFQVKNHMEHHNKSQRISCLNKSCTVHAKERKSLKRNKRYQEANTAGLLEDNHDHASSSRSAEQRNVHRLDPTGRPFNCPLCQKKFSEEAVLLTHLRMHTFEKLFKCPLCNYGSVLKRTLIPHVRASHSDIFFEFCCVGKSTCNHCHMNFGCATGLAMHTIKVKTPIVVLTRLQLKSDP